MPDVAGEAQLSWEVKLGYAFWLILFAAFVVDLIVGYSGVNRETVAVILVFLVILPSAASFKGGGFEFVRRTNETAEAFKEEFAKMEGRVAQLEDCCDKVTKQPPGGGDMQRMLMKQGEMDRLLGVNFTAEQAESVIRDMLKDRAYNMRSLSALKKATGMSEDKLVALLAAMPDVRKVTRSDTGQVFYGLSDRVTKYFQGHS